LSREKSEFWGSYLVHFTSLGLWLNTIKYVWEMDKTICKIELVRNASNDRYAAEMVLTKQSGVQIKAQIRNVKQISYNESALNV